MTLDTFNLLSYERQVSLVFASATFLATRWQNQEAVNLYYLAGQQKGVFVELFYDTQAKAIVRLRAFTSGRLLAEYAAFIQLSDMS
ncbi:hypothetical protein [Hymenobacter metallicola]|uniref:Uncharacterized protein n=1 Tax=Hymenobacter metallicola TaxID=2563114 RepID=A0A4Z0PUP2_9BACT|nr:hypothetical protein [Hymenobacter metallicola]TGE20974.1 hypothetical protein E5K02_24735 [Hymenobacter metallicola]